MLVAHTSIIKEPGFLHRQVQAFRLLQGAQGRCHRTLSLSFVIAASMLPFPPIESYLHLRPHPDSVDPRLLRIHPLLNPYFLAYSSFGRQ